MSSNRRSTGQIQSRSYYSPPLVPEPRKTVSTSKLPSFLRSSEEKTYDAKLVDALNDLERAQKLRKKAAETERRGGHRLYEWATGTHNSAIKDVVSKTGNVIQLHSDLVMDWIERTDQTTNQLRELLGKSKELESAERAYARLKDREERLERDLSQMRRERTRAQFEVLEKQLTEVRRQLAASYEALRRVRGEAETVRMFKLRRGFKTLADSGLCYSVGARAVYACQKELAELIPGLAVPGEEIFDLKYEGNPVTCEKVEHLRRFLYEIRLADEKCCAFRYTESGDVVHANNRRRNDLLRRSAPMTVSSGGRPAATLAVPASPPPPYTPTAPLTASERGTSDPERHISANNSSSSLSSRAQALAQTPRSRGAGNQLLASFLQPAHPDEHPQGVAQITSSTRREHRRSFPACTGCTGRLYPELPASPS